MKNVLSTITAASALAFLAAAPAAFADPTTPGPQSPPPVTWNQGSGVWTGGTSFGNAGTFGNAFGEGSGTMTRETGTAGFSDVTTGIEFSAGNCGDCESGAFTGRVFGFGQAGQQSFSMVTSDGGYAEGGSVAQAMTELGGDWHAYRGDTTAPGD